MKRLRASTVAAIALLAVVLATPESPQRASHSGRQQDRWSNGGARGLVVGRSTDGGAGWTIVNGLKTNVCTGGTSQNHGDYQRATDPWVTFGPSGPSTSSACRSTTSSRRSRPSTSTTRCSPSERASVVAAFSTAAFRGPFWFARSTNGGVSWEPAREIYDPGQNDQTIANQIVVHRTATS